MVTHQDRLIQNKRALEASEPCIGFPFKNSALCTSQLDPPLGLDSPLHLKVCCTNGEGSIHDHSPFLSDRLEYLFNFDSMFEIHDDIEVLKRMGMACGLEVGKCSTEDLKVARSLVPKALEPYVIGQLQPSTFTSCLVS